MDSRKDIAHLPNSELELMMIIWEAGKPVSRPEIEEKLDGKQKWGPTTVLKFLSRLAERGFISCEPMASGKKNLYTAVIGEDDYLASESNSVLGKLCGRSVATLVANLYENKTIDDSELDELQSFIDEAKRGKDDA